MLVIEGAIVTIDAMGCQRDNARKVIDKKADWVLHYAPGNPHIHLIETLRPLTKDGFSARKVVVLRRDGSPVRNDVGKSVY